MAEKIVFDECYDWVEFLVVLEEVVVFLCGMGLMVDVYFEGFENLMELVLCCILELLYGIGNFIENVVDFVVICVIVEGYWSDMDLIVFIFDDGLGFILEILLKIGEFYVMIWLGILG